MCFRKSDPARDRLSSRLEQVLLRHSMRNHFPGIDRTACNNLSLLKSNEIVPAFADKSLQPILCGVLVQIEINCSHNATVSFVTFFYRYLSFRRNCCDLLRCPADTLPATSFPKSTGIKYFPGICGLLMLTVLDQINRLVFFFYRLLPPA